MDHNQKSSKGLTVMIILAVLLIIALIAVSVRLYRYFLDGMDHDSSDPALSSEETFPFTEPGPPDFETDPPTVPFSETAPPSYPAESLPDYEVHTLPTTTEEPTTESATEPPTSKASTTEAAETNLPDASISEENTESTEIFTEQAPSETSAEFSENSDNFLYIGTWRLEYDLATAQETALKARYNLSRMPDRPVILRLFAELYEDGTLRLVFRQEDYESFRASLSAWYSDAGSIYAESGANTVQRAAFASWAAYRKGLYSLLSPDAVNHIRACWYADDHTVLITDGDEIQAELLVRFETDDRLSVSEFTVHNENYRDTVALLQSQLGFVLPFVLEKLQG